MKGKRTTAGLFTGGGGRLSARAVGTQWFHGCAVILFFMAVVFPRTVYALDWHIERVVDSGLRGDTSIALDAGGSPCIAFSYDPQQGGGTYRELTYARLSGDQWVLEGVDFGEGNYAFDNTLAFDRLGRPRIAYSWVGGTGGSQRYPMYA